MRSAFYLPAIDEDRAAFEAAFGALAERFGMQWRIAYARDRRRVALMASREDHCLLDLLWRNRRGELDMDVLCVISNHELLRGEVEALGVPFLHVPVTRETKPQAEQRTLDELAGRAELLVLARYMQILSGDFLARIGCPVINIHHSFLPAFAGAEPYRHAYERGVKLIGATAHYATEELDEGPIIEQDVQRVGHRYTVADLERVGRDLERGKCFACLCEDVTSKDVHAAIEEGYDSIELSKRYTTVTMGPCQGRMCQLAAIRLMAQETGQSLEQVGTTTARPPWVVGPDGGPRAAGRSSPPSARRSTAATASWARPSSGPATGAAPTTTATRRARRSRVHRGGRSDRRLDARQAAGPRTGGRRVPRPAVPEPASPT